MKANMKYRFGLVILFFAAALVILGTTAVYHRGSLLALFFPESVSVGELKTKYQTQRLRVLVVPGHDEDYSGTEFRGIKESDLTLKLGTELFKLFNADPKFEAFITRDEKGYLPEFANYFSQNRSNIVSFRERLKNTMNTLFEAGLVERRSIVDHNFAPEEVSVRLFGINKWANEKLIDLVVHVHFNDYPGHRADVPGMYSGFAEYVPESQLPNAHASRAIAQSVFNELKNTMAVSNYPPESAGVVDEQALIAIGSNASLNATVFLTEYGYISDTQLRSEIMRDALFPEMAQQTYAGVKKFFEPSYRINKYDSKLLPHYWSKDLSTGLRDNTDVVALQKALSLEKLYSSALTGNFFEVTKGAVMAFQEKYLGKASDGHVVGPSTRAMLNSLYSK